VILLLTASAALIVAGPAASAAVLLLVVVRRWMTREKAPVRTTLRPLLLVLLVELRAGASVLAALESTARLFPDDRALASVARLSRVIGIPATANRVGGEMRLLAAHLARAQVTGGSAADAVRRMIESDLARDRNRRMARLRSLPVRLMVPTTLLILPGVLLLAYGTSISRLFGELVVPF
jgi:hypothetical protein